MIGLKDIYDAITSLANIVGTQKEKKRKLTVYAKRLDKNLHINLTILLNNLKLALCEKTKFREFDEEKWIDELSYFKNDFTDGHDDSYRLISDFFTEIHYLNKKIKNGDFVKFEIIELSKKIFIPILFPYIFYLSDNLIMSIINDEMFYFFEKLKTKYSYSSEKNMYLLEGKRSIVKFNQNNYYRKTIGKYLEMVFNGDNEMIYCKLLLPTDKREDSLETFIDATYEDNIIKDGFAKIPNTPPINKDGLPDFSYIGKFKNFVAHGTGTIKINDEYETYTFENGKIKS